MILLDLFCGRWGWSRAFASRGWECVGVDLVDSLEYPKGCRFIRGDVLQLDAHNGSVWLDDVNFYMENPDFIVASSPCEEFSVHGMKNFHPNPKYPEQGIRLFNYTRQLCEASGVPYVMENVREAQKFIGQAKAHAGSFYLWGNAVPVLIPRGLVKGFTQAGGRYRAHENRSITPAEAATIPPELANCVAEYAERILEQKA